jgi:hypothetical protein
MTAFHGHGSEKYVADNGAVVNGDKCQIVFARRTELVYKSSLRTVTECGQSQVVNEITVFGFFLTDFDHL